MFCLFQQNCLDLGGNLATIRTPKEEAFVKGVAEGKSAWIGLSDAQEVIFISSFLKYVLGFD